MQSLHEKILVGKRGAQGILMNVMKPKNQYHDYGSNKLIKIFRAPSIW